MTSWNGVDNPLDPGFGGGLVIGQSTAGPLIFKGPVGPTPAFLNVRGSSVTQETGAYITGGVNAYAGNAVALNDAGNQIDYVTGGTAAGGTFLATSAATMMRTGSIQTGGGNITLTAPSVTIGGTLTSPGGAVTVTAVNAIVDDNPGVDIVGAQALLTGPLGVGTIANPIETAVANLTVSSVSAATQEIGIINSGNLVLDALNFSGSLAAIGATGTMTTGSSISLNPGTGLSLSGNAGLTLSQGIFGGNVLLNSGSGNLVVTTVMSGQSATLSGANIVINGGYVGTSGALNVNAANNLTVSGGTLFGGDNVFVNTGGNVIVNQGGIYGNPEVFMTVGGGQVLVNGTLAQPGRIEAGAVSTVYLTFPNLSSGATILVNGNPVYYDPASNTGFVSYGLPASPGNGMVITYGLLPANNLNVPADPLIVALNQATKPPEGQQSTGAKNDDEDSKKTAKKEAPVCR